MRLILSLALLMFFASGCGDDDSPNGDSAAPTLESLWPAEDGRYWAFQREYKWNHNDNQWPHYPTKAEVPPLGWTATQLHTFMLAGELGLEEGSSSGSWGMALDGTIMDGSGESCQQLTQTWSEALFMFDRVDGWMKTDDRITLHRSDSPSGTIRVLLERPVAATHQFQWLPTADPAWFDQYFASTRILGSFDAGGQTFESCVAALYLMTGRQASSGTNPDLTGWSRNTTIVLLVLAPDIGPIYLRESQFSGDFTDGQVDGPFHETELWLVDHGFL
jgi:hypothetical protein